MSKRRQNFQNIAWFLDLYRRKKLNMEPPFQRRSVWNDRYREQFIDTILLDYPAPAIFLFSTMDETGAEKFDLVDGKQRLTTIFDFVDGKLAVGSNSEISSLAGKMFSDLSQDRKVDFYQYDFSVEYLPTNNEEVINRIFDRLNRNVAKLTPQELRHAKYDGKFITAAEQLSDWLDKKFNQQMPRIAPQSRRQMKDVEFVATLLLFLEDGPKGHSVATLDAAFSNRDLDWPQEQETTDEFRAAIDAIYGISQSPDAQSLAQSRFRNQADFYSLFAAVVELTRESELPSAVDMAARLKRLLSAIEDGDATAVSSRLAEYLDAARAASNDPGSRNTRIGFIKDVLLGKPISDDTAGNNAAV